MIQLRKMTPSVYYEQSRDFQFIGRLYDMVLNSVKTNTDMIYSLPLSDDSNEKLLDLMTMTFGFQSKHEYNTQQLKALCACFAKIIRSKGSIQAIRDACNALVSAEGIRESIYIEQDPQKQTNLIFYVPQELSDLNLLKDLLNYILPAGMTYQLVKTLKTTIPITTTFSVDTNTVRYSKQHGYSKSIIVTKDANSEYPGSVYANKPFDKAGAFVNATVVTSSPNTSNDNE